jgi:tRNA threonylcarbamoyladenosine biosynthesis protein TsaE
MKVADTKEMAQYAARFAHQTAPRRDGATVVTLSGDLGAGKTTFAQAFAQALGVRENITSPTFVIQKSYELAGQKFQRIIHIDAYRLEGSHELEALAFKELLQDPANIILVEWPEKVPGIIPKHAVKIRFDIAGDERTISVDGGE